MIPQPSLQNLIDKTTLKWIFVGGKGGVGKTSCSAALGTLLSKHRKSVLLLSTDPAHNLSDAFDQKFGKEPSLVNGFDNLYAMEIDASASVSSTTAWFENEAGRQGENDDYGLCETADWSVEGTSGGASNLALNAIKDITNSLPGIDEVMTYTQVLALVDNMSFDVVVFDTAPTGHTLRLLSLPQMMEKCMKHLIKLKKTFAPMAERLLGISGATDALGGLEGKLPNMQKVTAQFKDASLTTFVCVCIAEYLSMYETERLVQELSVQEIAVDNIVINQLLLPPSANPVAALCPMCSSRRKQQCKYVQQICELYEDLHVTKLPALYNEVRGKEAVEGFAEHFIKPNIHLNGDILS